MLPIRKVDSGGHGRPRHPLPPERQNTAANLLRLAALKQGTTVGALSAEGVWSAVTSTAALPSPAGATSTLLPHKKAAYLMHLRMICRFTSLQIPLAKTAFPK